jgi:glycosyltransferase involved in cell wall biosynthesis
MTVTALIPTYNRRAHTFRAIDSVLGQTVPVDEIIVVDDGSTDGTAEAVSDRYGSRVVLFRQENAGTSVARNRGIREATGEWIAFLDSDDVWFPTKIERQMGALATLGGEFGVCFTDNLFGGNPDMKLSVFQQSGFQPALQLGPLEDATWYMLAALQPFFTSSLLISRSLLRALDGFDETLTLGEDADLVFRLSFRTRFCFVAEPLVEIDRTPARGRLCDLYTTRNDRKYENFERRCTKWLALPEVMGTQYERSIREMLREFRYDSTEAKIHHLRIEPALREIRRIRAMDEGYLSIFGTLLRRKLVKMRRSRGGRDATPCALLSEKRRKHFENLRGDSDL